MDELDELVRLDELDKFDAWERSMTTKISITNTTPGHKTIRVHTISLSQRGERYHMQVETLKPGDTGEFWVHSGQMLEVIEADDFVMPPT